MLSILQTHMVSFHCSKHATADGIMGVFKDCATFQEKQDKSKFVSVVVLDEVGLAEDSENMPLKVKYICTCTAAVIFNFITDHEDTKF